ncbi:unnamed protein product [Linum trigynum]|uniref:Uncharacterized protein n=1 Tax=Linum trigynum TaxID=586398 RepID=A0AAV2G8Q7_9ROSI
MEASSPYMNQLWFVFFVKVEWCGDSFLAKELTRTTAITTPRLACFGCGALVAPFSYDSTLIGVSRPASRKSFALATIIKSSLRSCAFYNIELSLGGVTVLIVQ